MNKILNLSSCIKRYDVDQDKAISPTETIAKIEQQLSSLSINILAETRRVDTNRLGIPVFLSMCGTSALEIMPTRKQMGKGASLEQAKASAVMELMERYGFFSYWQNPTSSICGTWNEVIAKIGEENVIAISEIIKACHDNISVDDAKLILNTRKWIFVPAVRIHDEKVFYIPLDLFKQLGEFNGSSAGNTDVESILQGVCELIERHVCAIVDKSHQALPTINLQSASSSALKDLIKAFEKHNIKLVLKDCSLDMPVPTVLAIAMDPLTFPASSEIVFTAGTACSAEKAAIRAITEVAQLAGDFCTAACYEASGLPKYSNWNEAKWLELGKNIDFKDMVFVNDNDIFNELKIVAKKLADNNFNIYTVNTTNKNTQVPSHYNIIPGFKFRERDINSSLGLFVGRMLSEQEELNVAENGLKVIEKIYPNSHFIPFFKGMIALRIQDFQKSFEYFNKSIDLQPEKDSKALASFYAGYVLTLQENWKEALDFLQTSVDLCPEMKEYLNLLGVCQYKLELFDKAIVQFKAIITNLDKGSVMDLQNLGMSYLKLGDKENAAFYLQAALTIDPTLSTARENLKNILEE